MRTLDKGQDKIQKICDVLRRETLEPAKQEAAAIVNEAKEQGQRIIVEAERQAQNLIEEARRLVEQERNVFYSSLTQATKQSLEALKQNIEEKLFNDELLAALAKHMGDPKVIAEIVSAIVRSLEKSGVSKDLSAIIPQAVSADEVSRFLGAEFLNRLQNGSIALGNFGGGAQIKLLDKKITIDMTDKTLAEYLKGYVRKDFRKLMFSQNGE